MNRTTIQLENNVDQTLRKLALKEKRLLREVINDVLRLGITLYGARAKPDKALKWHVSKAVPADHFDPSNRSTYESIIEREF